MRKSRGVLDAPVKPGHDSGAVATPYSTFTPDALMIGHQRSASSLW
jgi:hypothetical protein